MQQTARSWDGSEQAGPMDSRDTQRPDDGRQPFVELMRSLPVAPLRHTSTDSPLGQRPGHPGTVAIHAVFRLQNKRFI
jgi:hypothetical protein